MGKYTETIEDHWNGDAACNHFEGKLRINLVNKCIMGTASTAVLPTQAPIAPNRSCSSAIAAKSIPLCVTSLE